MNPSSQDHAPGVAIPDAKDEAALQALLDDITQGLAEGATFKDLYGVSDEIMEKIYAQAYELYQRGRLDEAERFFRLLCIYDFRNLDYALGLGAVFQLRKKYDKALDVYAMAYVIGEGDLRPLFYAGQCNMILRRLGKARRCFETMLQSPGDTPLHDKARAYLDAIVGAARNDTDDAGSTRAAGSQRRAEAAPAPASVAEPLGQGISH